MTNVVPTTGGAASGAPGPDDATAAACARAKRRRRVLAGALHAVAVLVPGAGARATQAVPAAPRDPGRAAALAALQREIDGFGFEARTTMGVGGFLTTRIVPIVLFRDGRALLDIGALSQPAGLAAHQRSKPAAWTRWRRQAGELQVERRDRDGAAWKALPFQSVHPRLPEGFRLDGRFRSLSGTGNVAVGGTDSVVAWREYAFTREGRVLRGGGAAAGATGGDVSVAPAAVAPGQRGRYRIDGLVLAIDWDDGGSERRLIVADPKDPKTAIWLDGFGYARR